MKDRLLVVKKEKGKRAEILTVKKEIETPQEGVDLIWDYEEDDRLNGKPGRYEYEIVRASQIYNCR